MAIEAVSLAVVRMPTSCAFLKTRPDSGFSLLGKLIRRTRLVTGNLKGLALPDGYWTLDQRCSTTWPSTPAANA